MQTLEARRPAAPSALTRINAVTGNDAKKIGNRLNKQLAGRLVELEKIMGTSPNPAINLYLNEEGNFKLNPAEILNGFLKQADELKAVVDDISGAAALLMRIHFFHGDREKAEEIADHFNLTELITAEKDTAHLLRGNLGYRLR